MIFYRYILISIIASFFLSSCGSNDTITNTGYSYRGTNLGNTRVVKSNPSLANDIVEIFIRRGCTAVGCHGNGSGGLTLTTSSTANYVNLVGVTSPYSGEVYVIQNDANNSYLVKKLENRQGNGNGNQMPPSGSSLDNIDLPNIKNWINTGALNN
jgi:hypothetical protein